MEFLRRKTVPSHSHADYIVIVEQRTPTYRARSPDGNTTELDLSWRQGKHPLWEKGKFNQSSDRLLGCESQPWTGTFRGSLDVFPLVAISVCH